MNRRQGSADAKQRGQIASLARAVLERFVKQHFVTGKFEERARPRRPVEDHVASCQRGGERRLVAADDEQGITDAELVVRLEATRRHR